MLDWNDFLVDLASLENATEDIIATTNVQSALEWASRRRKDGLPAPLYCYLERSCCVVNVDDVEYRRFE
jgi:hypothetical protein